MTVIADNLTAIKDQIRTYEKRYQRKEGSVFLLAVSKNQSLKKIQQAIDAGQFAFGENYLQEALPKITTLQNNRLEWHFIGMIQSNKTRKIAEHFSWVHSVNHHKIAQRLNDQRPNDLPPLKICIEVNVSHENSKSGIAIDKVAALAEFCSHLPRIHLRGLMTIPAPSKTLAEQRKEFHTLRSIFDDLKQKGLNIDTLSMGMSNDMEAAIAEGATIVRIGTALFGPRG